MSVKTEQLDDWCLQADRITRLVNGILYCVRKGDTERAIKELENTRSIACALIHDLEREGAQLPGKAGDHSHQIETPLHLMDTPANRRLLLALIDAAEAAQEVEKERGREEVHSLIIGGIAEEVRLEVFGPAGREERL